MTGGTREKLLDEVERGLAELEKEHDKRPLWSVEVALLDGAGNLVVTGPVTKALGWIVRRLRIVEDTTDISTAVTAHVHVREFPCPACREFHENEDPEADLPEEAFEEEDEDDGSAGPAYLDDANGPAPEGD